MTPRVLAPSPVSGAAGPGRRMAWTFGPSSLRLFAVGLLLIVPAWVDRRAMVVMFLWDAAVLAGWIVDLRRLPRPEQLTVTRSWNGALALGADTSVRLEVVNASQHPIRLWISDYAHPSLQPDLLELQALVPAQDPVSVDYAVTPRTRGDAALDIVALRYRSAAALAERWAIVHLPQTVRVYPDIREAQRHSLALIRARQVAMEKRRAHTTGLGRDFESLREFQPGDEMRDVCWTATARRGRLVTKTYQPERSQTLWILVDAGRLMRARIDGRTRLDRAANAAFTLAQVASAAGDRVALLAYGRGTQQRLAPSRGASHLRSMLDALAVVRTEQAEADHARAASEVMAAQKRRALVVWLTDIAESAAVPEVIESASRMVPRHVLLFVVLRHAELAALASAAPSDAGGMFRALAAQEMVERRTILLSQLRQAGALAVEVPSEELTATLVNRYLTIKEQNLV